MVYFSARTLSSPLPTVRSAISGNRRQLDDGTQQKELERILTLLNVPFPAAAETRQLYLRALTHSSASPSRDGSYQRLEFLGDSALSLAVKEALYQYPFPVQEGLMSDLHSLFVSNKALARLASELKLQDAMHSVIPVTPNMMADSLEALFGAIYLATGNVSSIRALFVPKVSEALGKIPLSLQGKHRGGNVECLKPYLPDYLR